MRRENARPSQLYEYYRCHFGITEKEHAIPIWANCGDDTKDLELGPSVLRYPTLVSRLASLSPSPLALSPTSLVETSFLLDTKSGPDHMPSPTPV